MDLISVSPSPARHPIVLSKISRGFEFFDDHYLYYFFTPAASSLLTEGEAPSLNLTFALSPIPFDLLQVKTFTNGSTLPPRVSSHRGVRFFEMQDTASPHLETFLGIRFLISGVDPSDQVRSKLLSRGGVEAQDFTHLIVDNNTIYDDPACVSARNNGKTVVTKLWVDHSSHFGLVVDSTKVIYQPPKGLNGIPGAKHLIISSTGYSIKERENIMTMVRLMGSQFSKILVSHETTHLICYKNKGPKYDVARRYQIKIVNLRWLEDCLRTWKLLPEDEYSKSGYEMELMEAEVRDSEDDVSDGTSLKLRTSCIVNQSPQIRRNASPKTSNLSESISEVPAVPVGPDGFLNVHNETLTTPVTKRKVDTTSHLIDPSGRTPGSAEAADKIDAVYMSVEKPSDSNMKSSVAPVDGERELIVDQRIDLKGKSGFTDDENGHPDEAFDQSDVLVKEMMDTVGLAAIEKEFQEVQQMEKNSIDSEVDHAVEDPQERDKSISEQDGDTKTSETQWLPSSKSKRKAVDSVNDNSFNSSKVTGKEEQHAAEGILEREPPASCLPSVKKISRKRTHRAMEAVKENKAVVESHSTGSKAGKHVEMCMTTANGGDQLASEGKPASAGGEISSHVERQPMCFMSSGQNRPQRKELRNAIKDMKGQSFLNSHQWSNQVTHLVVADPLRRTEKVFAAAASGRWILSTDYLLACCKEGRFLPEEPYEWHKKGVNKDGSINLESPRKWRLLREKTGHGAFHGMRIVIYGVCIDPPLDTLRRAVEAGDGEILATAPPYTHILNSQRVDYAIISRETPFEDVWVQEFARLEIPCVTADYLVDYVFRAGSSLDKHVLFDNQEWAAKSFSNLARKAEEIVNPAAASSPKAQKRKKETSS
ncbi:unnamed protein product [Linum tenue]|uniref:BRCT domain-containing protein n=1 Tax=Linum tenue TaxID=586396 RepID=A0AAV0KUZ1_9ROSI|nr:unnamed protein product [Linum tenue]